MQYQESVLASMPLAHMCHLTINDNIIIEEYWIIQIITFRSWPVTKNNYPEPLEANEWILLVMEEIC